MSSDPASLDGYAQRLAVETPEHVVLEYEIGGLGSRVLAALVDGFLLGLWLIALALVLKLFGTAILWTEITLVVGSFLSFWGYFFFFEAFRQGQTPGKRFAGIRVVADTGHPARVGPALIRGLLRMLDLFPPVLLLDAALMVLHPRAKRLGDMVAGTIVVRDRPEAVRPAPTTPEETAEAGAPELPEDEFRLLREFTQRAATLNPEARQRLATRLEARFAERYPARPPDALQFLAELYQAELTRRRGRFGFAQRGGGRAERFVARKQVRWDEFQQQATRAASEGLDSFSADALPEFAARYREITADLARARTYGAPVPVVQRLERLAAAGHNALYRDERTTARRIWRVLMRECPAAVVQARRAVLVAALAFGGPMLAGYLLIRDRPGLAGEVLPDGLLRRAEAGRTRRAQGLGYYEASRGERPLAAAFIITNNVKVAFVCFAGGVFAGVGSLFLLFWNGLSIGTTFGHFANMGLFSYIGLFTLAHGALELFAITVAGAAGLLLGLAVVAPGRWRRGDALVIQGRVAVRMVGAVVVMLAVAGTIEGFVSTGGGGVAYRAAMSLSSLAFLALYLANGWRYLRQHRRRVAAGPQRSRPGLNPARARRPGQIQPGVHPAPRAARPRAGRRNRQRRCRRRTP